MLPVMLVICAPVWVLHRIKEKVIGSCHVTLEKPKFLHIPELQCKASNEGAANPYCLMMSD